MKSTFGRLFTTLCLILLASMVLIGVAFQWLSSRYLTNQTITSLQNDGKVIASLFRACYADKGISNQDFYMALTVANSVSGADAVICDANGTILMCAASPMGCEHVGLRLDKTYRDRVFSSESITDTGFIQGLYPERRYSVSIPVLDERTQMPVLLADLC